MVDFFTSTAFPSTPVAASSETDPAPPYEVTHKVGEQKRPIWWPTNDDGSPRLFQSLPAARAWWALRACSGLWPSRHALHAPKHWGPLTVLAIGATNYGMAMLQPALQSLSFSWTIILMLWWIPFLAIGQLALRPWLTHRAQQKLHAQRARLAEMVLPRLMRRARRPVPSVDRLLVHPELRMLQTEEAASIFRRDWRRAQTSWLQTARATGWALILSALLLSPMLAWLPPQVLLLGWAAPWVCAFFVGKAVRLVLDEAWMLTERQLTLLPVRAKLKKLSTKSAGLDQLMGLISQTLGSAQSSAGPDLPTMLKRAQGGGKRGGGQGGGLN